MYKYIVVLLDEASVSFCYYDNLEKQQTCSGLISLEKLKRIIAYSKLNGSSINFVYGRKQLPAEYEAEIEKAEHIKIVPFELYKYYKDSVCVINEENFWALAEIENNSSKNLILRLPKSNLYNLCGLFLSLHRKFKRLNVLMLDIDSYSQSDLDEYAGQLKLVREKALSVYNSGGSFEISNLSDRLILSEMNNCDAGLKHVTYAPNGKFYLCPGFYYENPENSIGDLDSGIEIKNGHLLKIEYAPICRNCDAFHCKRCVFINRKSTLELNTPSRQQCMASHIERNNSRQLGDSLKKPGNNFSIFEEIEEVDYLDPFEMIRQTSPHERNIKKKRESDRFNELDNITDRELLLKIYEMQKEILNRINSGKLHD